MKPSCDSGGFSPLFKGLPAFPGSWRAYCCPQARFELIHRVTHRNALNCKAFEYHKKMIAARALGKDKAGT